MRTSRLLTLALLTAGTLGLVGCGASGDASPAPTTSAGIDAAAVAAVEWSDGATGGPTLTFDLPFSVSDGVARLVEDGDGPLIEAGQALTLNYVIFSGTDGTIQFSTYEVGIPEELVLTQDVVAPSVWDILVGNHVGARIIYAAPDTTTPPTDASAVSSIVIALTVSSMSTVLPRAQGEAIAPVAGLPGVTLAENGAPSIDFTGAVKPDGLVVQPLIVGAGPVVVENQSVTVHYTGWLWDGAQFDSSWDRGASATFALTQGALIDGWVQGLADQPIGSQVLLVVPPELGYKEAGQGSIPGGATLVFVVDILAAT